MCLILVAWHTHPDLPLVVAANRDEYYVRATANAGPWPEAPQVIGGRDLEAGGTWLGITESGRFAAVTNVREPGMAKGRCSRGLLTRDFLVGEASAGRYAAEIAGDDYSGFNLLVGDGRELWYRSNRDGPPHLLRPGVYAVSNHLLDTPWPKLVSAKSRFSEALAGLPDTDAFFAILADASLAADKDLPATGVPLEWERLLSAIFVKSPDYGTRASTVLIVQKDGESTFEERRFGPEEQFLGRTRIPFPAPAPAGI
ncbi:MAG: NRDE family protein [Betaproteobacteria bacterium]